MSFVRFLLTLHFTKTIDTTVMPTNKNALLRYQILDRCFSSKVRYCLEELKDVLEEKLGYSVSMRTIRYDIENMRNSPYDAPIEATPYDGKKCYYHYSDPEFSIFNVGLTNEELDKLLSTIQMLNRFRDTPANAWLGEVINKLECRLGAKASYEKLISFDQNDKLKGLEHLSGLLEATTQHQTLELTYHPYSQSNERLITVSPYYLKQYNGRWFLFGMNASNNRVESFAFDRIEKYAVSDKPFVKNEAIDFSSYFNDVVGVSVPSDNVPKEEVVLKFSDKRFPYVVSKPIHPSQKVIAPCTISITVKPNFELDQHIFSYIPDVEVVSPGWLRDKVLEKIKENIKKYESVQNGCTDKL